MASIGPVYWHTTQATGEFSTDCSGPGSRGLYFPSLMGQAHEIFYSVSFRVFDPEQFSLKFRHLQQWRISPSELGTQEIFTQTSLIIKVQNDVFKIPFIWYSPKYRLIMRFMFKILTREAPRPPQENCLVTARERELPPLFGAGTKFTGNL